MGTAQPVAELQHPIGLPWNKVHVIDDDARMGRKKSRARRVPSPTFSLPGLPRAAADQHDEYFTRKGIATGHFSIVPNGHDLDTHARYARGLLDQRA